MSWLLAPKYTENGAKGDFVIKYHKHVIILIKTDNTTWKSTSKSVLNSEVCPSHLLFMSLRKISRLFLLNHDLNKNQWDIYPGGQISPTHLEPVIKATCAKISQMCHGFCLAVSDTIGILWPEFLSQVGSFVWRTRFWHLYEVHFSEKYEYAPTRTRHTRALARASGVPRACRCQLDHCSRVHTFLIPEMNSACFFTYLTWKWSTNVRCYPPTCRIPKNGRFREILAHSVLVKFAHPDIYIYMWIFN